LGAHLNQLYRSIGHRDVIEIAILTLLIYALLRFLNKTRVSGMVRGLGIVLVGFVLLAQVVVAALDFTGLSKVLDYVASGIVFALLVIFQPELRRALMLLGHYRLMRGWIPEQHPLADCLADAALALSRDRTGALIALERDVPLDPCMESGEAIDGVLSAALLQSIFNPRSPLHDGAVIIRRGRIAAAACQLPLGQPPDNGRCTLGMRHRAAQALSEETDAICLVVSEETGRISVATRGHLTAVGRDILSRHLAQLLRDTAPEANPRRAA
jgi:diadenylate cyclase